MRLELSILSDRKDSDFFFPQKWQNVSSSQWAIPLRVACLTCAMGASERNHQTAGLLSVEESLFPWPSIAPSAHVFLSPHLYATAQYFSCSLSHSLFSVSLGNQTGVQSTFTTFYEVECDGIDGSRASQLSTHPPTCAEGATLEAGSSDSSTVSNLLSHLCL